MGWIPSLLDCECAVRRLQPGAGTTVCVQQGAGQRKKMLDKQPDGQANTLQAGTGRRFLSPDGDDFAGRNRQISRKTKR
jgi:hypothetical protein